MAWVSVKGCNLERARQMVPTIGATSVMKPNTVSTHTAASAGVLTPISLPSFGESATSAETIATTWALCTGLWYQGTAAPATVGIGTGSGVFIRRPSHQGATAR